MLKADQYHDEIMALCAVLEKAQMQDRDEVEHFVRAFTKLTFDYAMFGLMFDYYLYDVEVLRENAVTLHGVQEVITERQALLAAFPNLKTDVGHVIISPDGNGGWKVFRRMYVHGTHTGPSAHGLGTGRELGNDCLSLSMFYLSKIDGQWKITYEMDMRKVF